MKTIAIQLIKFYKKHISPHMGDNCRFSPTCSEYMMQAMEIHGFCKGLLLGTWRLLRCNPFGKVGYDPVPEKHAWVNPKRKLRRENPRTEN